MNENLFRERLLTVDDVAQLLCVPKSFVYDRTQKKARDPIPHIKLGKYVRFWYSDLLEYLERLRRK